MDTEKKGYQDRHKGRRAQKMKPKEILGKEMFLEISTKNFRVKDTQNPQTTAHRTQ